MYNLLYITKLLIVKLTVHNKPIQTIDCVHVQYKYDRFKNYIQVGQIQGNTFRIDSRIIQLGQIQGLYN